MRAPARAVLAAITATLVLLTGPPVAAADSSDLVDIAHRGASGTAPENTLAAVHAALDDQASYVEVDVQRTADDELVLLHDVSLERTTDVEQVYPHRAPWHVGDFTLEELRRLDAGSWFAPKFTGEPIPTLRQTVQALRGRAGLLLELKSPALYPGIESDIDKELSSIPGYLPAALAADQLVVQSFDHSSMRTYDDLDPRVPTGLLYGRRPTPAELAAVSGWADQINPSYRVTDSQLVQQVHQEGMTISVYTLNTTDLMRRYADMGVDGIITDYPARLRQLLGRPTG